jgi:hypothetical protein
MTDVCPPVAQTTAQGRPRRSPRPPRCVTRGKGGTPLPRPRVSRAPNSSGGSGRTKARAEAAGRTKRTDRPPHPRRRPRRAPPAFGAGAGLARRRCGRPTGSRGQRRPRGPAAAGLRARASLTCRTPVSSRSLAAAGPQNWTFGLGQYTRSGGEEAAAAGGSGAAAPTGWVRFSRSEPAPRGLRALGDRLGRPLAGGAPVRGGASENWRLAALLDWPDPGCRGGAYGAERSGEGGEEQESPRAPRGGAPRDCAWGCAPGSRLSRQPRLAPSPGSFGAHLPPSAHLHEPTKSSRRCRVAPAAPIAPSATFLAGGASSFLAHPAPSVASAPRCRSLAWQGDVPVSALWALFSPSTPCIRSLNESRGVFFSSLR